MVQLYGTATIFLVIVYVFTGVIYKYALFVDYLLRLNLIITCLLLLWSLHPFGSYNLFIFGVTEFVNLNYWLCGFLVILLMVTLVLNFISYVKGKIGEPMKN